jgi:peptidyl-dipeptidase Dcp
MTNPLLKKSSYPHEAVPFDEIRTEHFLPGLEESLARSRRQIDAIKGNPETPTFANTVRAIDEACAETYDIAYVYSNLRHAHGDSGMHALAREIMPRLIQLESDINLDEKLFARVETVYQGRNAAGLTTEQLTLTEKTWKSFKRNGALLSAAEKEKLRAIDEQLSTLGPEYSEHVLKSSNAFELVLTDEQELAGLPDSLVAAARQAAKERGKPDAWVFTLSMTSAIPFQKYADRRDLREKIWTAWSTRASSGETANHHLVKKIATLRHQRAKLLGYDSHAHFQMEERMAKHPDTVRTFLNNLLAKSMPAARKEVEDLKAYMKAKGCQDELMPWDYPYWANKMKEEQYAFNAEELRPYFKLENVLQGAFDVATRLFGLEFAPREDLPVYADDVVVYEVTSKADGKYIGLFYADFFPRNTKGSGAWCTRFKGQWQEQGSDHRPHVSIVCNFTKPTDDKPSLLTFSEVTTLFHEFGHALHSLLSRCEHRSLCCTNVYRDFVELPSQIMENWVREKESLAVFARHYQTNEVIPDDKLQKLIDSDNFHAGYMMVRQLRFALLDLGWYGGDPSGVTDILQFEMEVVRPTDLLPVVRGANISNSFEHIFAGGYSAGYYGYKWAEVLDADAFELFRERGVFNRDVADRFRECILERGGSEHPMVLYKRFRGREPDPDALLRRSGLM